jgi:hypothetical protein
MERPSGIAAGEMEQVVRLAQVTCGYGRSGCVKRTKEMSAEPLVSTPSPHHPLASMKKKPLLYLLGILSPLRIAILFRAAAIIKSNFDTLNYFAPFVNLYQNVSCP